MDSKGASFDGFHSAEADRPPPSMEASHQTRRLDDLMEHMLRPMGQAGRTTMVSQWYLRVGGMPFQPI